MILSGVARSRGRFGKLMIGQMLSGSKSAKVKKFGLDKLSTHGLLSELRQTEILDLLDQLIDVGLIEQVDVDRFRPVVRLTVVGRDIMRDENQPIPSLEISPMLLGKLSGIVMANAPTTEPSPPSAPVLVEQPLAPVAQSAMDVDESMLEILKIWRREVADATGVAPVRLLSDDSLQLIARTKPGSAVELQRITGWDSDLGAFYGPALLNVVAEQESIRDEAEDSTAREQNQASPAETPSDESQADSGPDSYWTWKLFMAGFSFEDCQKIRRLPRERILLHLQEASEVGWEVKPSWFQE